MVKTAAKAKAAAKSSAAPKAPKVRSRKDMDARAALARIERCEGFKVQPQHRWLLQMSLSDAEVRAAACRREVQEAHGLGQVQAQVAGLGHTPDHCRCQLSGLPDALDGVASDLLYERLCELGSLEMHLRDQMCRLADVLLERGFLTLTEVSDEEDDEQR